jgi:hypothetical protein
VEKRPGHAGKRDMSAGFLASALPVPGQGLPSS